MTYWLLTADRITADVMNADTIRYFYFMSFWALSVVIVMNVARNECSELINLNVLEDTDVVHH